jgi:hypothetical protein
MWLHLHSATVPFPGGQSQTISNYLITRPLQVGLSHIQVLVLLSQPMPLLLPCATKILLVLMLPAILRYILCFLSPQIIPASIVSEELQ